MKKMFILVFLMFSGFFIAQAQRVTDPSLQEDTTLCQSSFTLLDVTDTVKNWFPNHPTDAWHATAQDPFVFFRRAMHGDSVVIACLVHNQYDTLHRLVCSAWEEIDRITIFYYVYGTGKEPTRKIVYSFNLASRNPVRWLGQVCSETQAELQAVYTYTARILKNQK